MNVDEQLQKLCKKLNIKYNKHDAQDWGIIHSDALRLGHFINYYTTTPLNEYEQFFIFELIIASYNDAMLENLITEDIEHSFLDVINGSNTNGKLEVIKSYWRKIYSAEEFPVGKLL